MSGFYRIVEGLTDYSEEVIVDTNDEYIPAAEDGHTCIDVRVHSAGDIVYASITLEGARELAKNLLDAVEFLENP